MTSLNLNFSDKLQETFQFRVRDRNDGTGSSSVTLKNRTRFVTQWTRVKSTRLGKRSWDLRFKPIALANPWMANQCQGYE